MHIKYWCSDKYYDLHKYALLFSKTFIIFTIFVIKRLDEYKLDKREVVLKHDACIDYVNTKSVSWSCINLLAFF